ncbi:MAG TPA: HAMP domain-containing sensor histidine kinase [Pseudonocardiaceae bacterium]|nr:HAMP domain-containing sensor histidine kinase [Pseudonocardiaceae bacterium]
MRRRILRAILLAVAVTACALGIPLGYSAIIFVQTSAGASVTDTAQVAANTVDDQLTTNNGRIDQEGLKRVLQGGQAMVTFTYLGRKTTVVVGDSQGEDVLKSSAPLVHGGTLELIQNARPLRQLQAELTVLVALLVVLSVGTGTVVATVTARRLAEPMRHVADRAARLGAGDFRPDPNRYGVEELDMVAHALDTSGSALADLVQRERDLVGDVSHQLRSRLTALQLRLETMAGASSPEIAEDAAAALEQSERLTKVLEELLAAAGAARAVQAEPIDLATELPAIAADWRELLRADGRALRVRVPDGLLARATPGRLREAIGVLLDNSLRHGTGTVTISARRGEATAVVEVSDGGPGVPEELAAHVFERGVSGGGSTGVGLALARALVDADGGRLELSTSRPATFTLFLPVARAGDLVATPWRAEPGPR